VSQPRIHAIATTPQYRRHVEAVWKHIDPELKGRFITGRGSHTRTLPKDDVVMVGGFYDIDPVPQRIVYVEHGAGQSYQADEKTKGHPSYHGSNHPARVIGYISPNQRVADSWNRPAFVAGCPPLDWWDEDRPKPGKVAAITFHFDARRIAPEAWSAREHWIEDLHTMVALLRSYEYEVIGTKHPRDPVGHRIWRNLGVEYVSDPDEVLDRCRLLIADNTSLMYEAAHLHRTVIALNAPWYRKDVEHGLRFWDHVPGAMVDNIEEFAALTLGSYSGRMDARLAASSASSYAYGMRPGKCGQLAAAWVEQLATGQV
jgi:hypothetical protein